MNTVAAVRALTMNEKREGLPVEGEAVDATFMNRKFSAS
jgi:hypothetical protein